MSPRQGVKLKSVATGHQPTVLGTDTVTGELPSDIGNRKTVSKDLASSKESILEQRSSLRPREAPIETNHLSHLEVGLIVLESGQTVSLETVPGRVGKQDTSMDEQAKCH